MIISQSNHTLSIRGLLNQPVFYLNNLVAQWSKEKKKRQENMCEILLWVYFNINQLLRKYEFKYVTHITVILTIQNEVTA